ncbi:MAG: hypothetical protein Fur005_05660 [Roseiflexaceae bacterium]
MALLITILVVLIPVILAGVGAMRDLRRGALSIGSTLLGATLAEFWSPEWGAQLAERTGLELQSAIFIVAIFFLFGVAGFIGYGGGLLLAPRLLPLAWPQRVSGASIGILNGSILVGYCLRFAAQSNEGFATLVAESQVAQALHDGLPLIFLAAAAMAGLTILIRWGMDFYQRSRPRSGGGRPVVGASSPLPTPSERRTNQLMALDRIKQVTTDHKR